MRDRVRSDANCADPRRGSSIEGRPVRFSVAELQERAVAMLDAVFEDGFGARKGA
jgi:hypothetical protein